MTGKPDRKLIPLFRNLFFMIIFVGHAWLFRGFYVDDAFISLRFVRQWTSGNGLVYNISERVEGYSNFLWIVLLAPFDIVGINLVLASKIAGILLGLMTLIVTSLFAKRFLAETPQFIAPLFLAVTSSFAAWAMGGLETMLFSFLLILSIYLFLKEEQTHQGWYSGVCFGLLALTRPEGLLFGVIAVGYGSYRLYQLGTYPNRRDYLRFGSFALIVGSYFLWRFIYYGYPLPNTVYAKSMGFYLRSVIEGIYYIYISIGAIGGIFFLVFSVFASLVSQTKRAFIFYLILNIAVYGLFIVIGGGDWMPMKRFLVHILPLIYLVSQAGLGELGKIWKSKWSTQLIMLLVIIQAGYLLAISFDQRFINKEIGKGSLMNDTPKTSAFIRKNLHPNATIAVVDAGRNVFYLPLSVHVIDMVGLTDKHIAHLPPKFPNGLFGRGDGFGKWDVDYVLDQTPQFIQVHLESSQSSHKLQTDFTGTTLLVNDARFQHLYQLVADPEVNGLFELKD